MNRSDEISELFSALSLAQGEIEGARKDSTNPHFKSRYADLASVRDALREPFAKHGLALIQLPRAGDGIVEVETILSHKSGQFISETLSCPLATMTAQTIGSAITYLRRYSAMAMAGVAPEDDDGNSASERHTYQDDAIKRFTPQESAAVRDQMLSELDAVKTRDEGKAWAQRNNADYERLTPEHNAMVAARLAIIKKRLIEEAYSMAEDYRKASDGE